jgi:hypothetical protein
VRVRAPIPQRELGLGRGQGRRGGAHSDSSRRAALFFSFFSLYLVMMTPQTSCVIYVFFNSMYPLSMFFLILCMRVGLHLDEDDGS